MRKTIVATLVLVSSLTTLRATTINCTAGPVSGLIGTRCSIGSLTFHFTGYNSFTGVSASSVILTPNASSFYNPSFSLGSLTASEEGSPFGEQYVEIDYTVTVNAADQGPYPYEVQELGATATGDTFGSTQNPTSGDGTIDFASCIGKPFSCPVGAGDNTTAQVIDGAVVVNSDPVTCTGCVATPSYTGLVFENLTVSNDITTATIGQGTASFSVGLETPESTSLALFGIGLVLLLFPRLVTSTIKR